MDDNQVQGWLSDEERALFAGPMIPVFRELARHRAAMLALELVTDALNGMVLSQCPDIVRRWMEDIDHFGFAWPVEDRARELH